MRQRIIQYIRAGYPGLYLVSPEEQRVEAEFKSIAKEIGFRLYVWSATTGLLDVTSKSVRDCNDPLAVLLAVPELPKESIILLRDIHAFLTGEPNPVLVRQFREVLQHSKANSKVLVVLGCRLCLPPELEREMTLVEFKLPGKEELSIVLDGVLESAAIKTLAASIREAALDAANGLPTIEAENALALSVVESKGVDSAVISREKAQAVKKSGILELVETRESLHSIGGLDVLKTWLLKRKDAFGQKAIDYGLPTPKGLLIVGIPGTGKSLTAKATAKVFGVPLLKLDAGKIYAGIVGQSESNLRLVIQTADAIAPCVLWLDEIEKGMAGSKSSGATDGGTSARVFGSFISWRQEKTAAVFVVATANDVSQLPPEMLRKGRWDELFFVDLPNETEREQIWKIQIGKYGRDAAEYDIKQLARITDGYTGAEIEAVFVEALFLA